MRRNWPYTLQQFPHGPAAAHAVAHRKTLDRKLICMAVKVDEYVLCPLPAFHFEISVTLGKALGARISRKNVVSNVQPLEAADLIQEGARRITGGIIFDKERGAVRGPACPHISVYFQQHFSLVVACVFHPQL